MSPFCFSAFRRRFIFSLLIFCFSFPYITQAQSSIQNGFRAGLNAGFNASQVDGDGFNGWTKVGLHVGVVAELPLSKFFSVSMGIEYDQKGSKSAFNYNQLYPDSSFLYKLNYVEVPILLHYYYKPKWVLGAGLTYGRLLNVSEYIGTYEQFNLTGNQLSPTGTGTYPITNYDLSGIGEGQYLLNDNFNVGIRYSYSIVPFASSIRSRFVRHGQFHNVFTFTLGYMFGKPHKYGSSTPPPRKIDKPVE